jgi:trans-aconitate methyltransferase
VASQSWDPARYDRTARFVSDLGQPLLDLLGPKPGERILDLGCGDGALTARLVESGAIVVGVDASAAMVAAARERGIDARVMRGEALTFDGEFDAIFSNAAIHWMSPPERVADGMARALRLGGRLVAELGGAGNNATVREELFGALAARGVDGPALSPWYFPTIQEYRDLLQEVGFKVDVIDLFPRPTPIPGDIVEWLGTFGEVFLTAVPPADRPALEAELNERLAPRLRQPDGTWVVDYVRLRLAAHI